MRDLGGYFIAITWEMPQTLDGNVIQRQYLEHPFSTRFCLQMRP